ncbi:MAG: RNA binding protein Gar1 [Cenarchaeum symbiont of Oopsacas minuta]|nr:RNA binding protein Gar1 [Cenarchaeum symbiont of Oopsacas minuta]
MQEIGKIVHLAHSGRLIVKLIVELSEGDMLYDQKENKVAKVAELIGPVSAPFASAIPNENFKGKVNSKMYSTYLPASERRKHR